MITVGMNYKVIDGKQNAFIKMFNAVVGVMQEMGDHKESHLYCDVNDPCSFLIVSEWHRRQAFDEFIRSEAFAKVASWGKEQILSGRPKHEVYGQDEPAA
jgi:heme-degrading monooxygenase HmoA